MEVPSMTLRMMLAVLIGFQPVSAAERRSRQGDGPLPLRRLQRSLQQGPGARIGDGTEEQGQSGNRSRSPASEPADRRSGPAGRSGPPAGLLLRHRPENRWRVPHVVHRLGQGQETAGPLCGLPGRRRLEKTRPGTRRVQRGPAEQPGVVQRRRSHEGRLRSGPARTRRSGSQPALQDGPGGASASHHGGPTVPTGCAGTTLPTTPFSRAAGWSRAA